MKTGVTPDVLTSAKGLGGGSIGAMLTTNAAAKAFGVGAHGSTYGGNPLVCAVAESVLDILLRESTLSGVTAKRSCLWTDLEALNKRFWRLRRDSRRRVVDWLPTNAGIRGQRQDLVKCAEEAGLLVLIAGPDVMRFAPSLLISEADIAEGMSRFAVAIERFVTTVRAAAPAAKAA